MVEHRTRIGLEPAARIAIEHLSPELRLPAVEADRLGVVGDDENVEALCERNALASDLRDWSDGDPTTPEAEPAEDRIRGGGKRDEPDDRTGEDVQPDERLPPWLPVTRRRARASVAVAFHLSGRRTPPCRDPAP